MEKSANTINYEPLPADGSQIRLLAILPGEGYGKVECIVENFPFIEDEIDNLEYEALSYVWGNATITTPISLNGQLFQVTTNLEAALRALRLQDNKRLIWIDAICINQTNIQERNQEVRRMGEVYRHAGHVIIWLGREIEPGDIPVQGDRVAEKTHELLNSLANASSEDDEAAAVILDRTGDVMYALQLLLKFFYRPWFMRVWILQEIALAKTATAVYGDRWIGWDRLVQAVDALRRLQLGLNTHLWRISGAVRADKVRRCWMRARDATQQDGPRPSMHFELGDLLWQTRFCEWTEPRDRLYGILGLVMGDLRSEKLLEIDYTKPVADVFRDLSIFMIQGGMLSHVLCSVTDSMDNLPSWATTWTSTLVENPSPDGSVASRLSNGIITYMQIYQLKDIEPPPNPPRLSTDLRQITIKGRIFDAYGIRHIGRRFEPVATSNESIDELARIYRARLIEWEDEMERQHCAHERFKIQAERREAWKHALLHELPGDRTETGQHYDMLTDRENELPLARDSDLIMRIVVDLKSILGSYCDLRRPFVTMLGQMGSTGINRDVHFQDKVCVFVGSAVPYLLRPVDQARGLYRFVGCCWVPGLVDLDMVEAQRRGFWEFQDITLI